MKPFLIGAAITGAMLLGWEVGEWMQARFGLLQSFALWSLACVPVWFWVNRGGKQ